ncbi:response regulator [Mesoterricola silvestris]|uniref:DNA-binding response regulator n=1 Tax=Mesoterricola silvestris TaxID=2927979 RepID=A0AA48GKA3_9BACT|nr:response regulator [Mesoterricola silvestris]BDU72897.1 DNA-binding response regulator [Mesoterricola silvestris]
MTQEHPLILVIEDEPPLRRYLRATLQSFGYRVEEAATGEEGKGMAARVAPDVVLLDLGLPDMDGLDLARELRGWSAVPIIIVSARGKEEDKIRALDVGADDYLTKPFGSGELLARIRVALRHAAAVAGAAPEAVAEIGPLRVDFASREVTVDGAEVHLSPNEFALLGILVRHAGKVLTHRQLLHEVWGGVASAQPTYLRVYMANLRKKLEPDPARPRLLLTEPGIGYRLKC